MYTRITWRTYPQSNPCKHGSVGVHLVLGYLAAPGGRSGELNPNLPISSGGHYNRTTTELVKVKVPISGKDLLKGFDALRQRFSNYFMSRTPILTLTSPRTLLEKICLIHSYKRFLQF